MGLVFFLLERSPVEDFVTHFHGKVEKVPFLYLFLSAYSYLMTL